MSRHIPILLLALAGLAALPPGASAQQPARQAPFELAPDGTDMLQFLLDASRIKPIRNSDVGRELGQLEDVIVVVLGDSSQRIGAFTAIEWANKSVMAGGAALVAVDSRRQLNFGTPVGPGFPPPGPPVEITGAMVRGTDPKTCFLGKDTLPFAVPRQRPLAGGPEWNLFDGLHRVATNQPSAIWLRRPHGVFRSILAGFPDSECTNGNGNIRILDTESEVFAVGGSGQHPLTTHNYRLLALSDPSVFINEMMLAEKAGLGPTDNFEFAQRVVKFLSEEGTRKRARCLFIQNGQVVDRFDRLRPLFQPPVPKLNLWDHQDKIIEFIDKTVDQFQEKDVANQALFGKEESQGRETFKRIMAALLAVLAIRAGWYLMKRLAQSRRPAPTAAAPPGGLPVLANGDRPAGAFDRRQRELLRRNNLYEPVRTAIADFFAEAGVVPELGQKLPKLTISDAVRNAKSLREALADLWKIAAGPPRPVSIQRWRDLEPIFDRVRQAYLDGKWQFQA